jgi:hypothetical protein
MRRFRTAPAAQKRASVSVTAYLFYLFT